MSDSVDQAHLPPMDMDQAVVHATYRNEVVRPRRPLRAGDDVMDVDMSALATRHGAHVVVAAQYFTTQVLGHGVSGGKSLCFETVADDLLHPGIAGQQGRQTRVDRLAAIELRMQCLEPNASDVVCNTTVARRSLPVTSAISASARRA